MSQGTRRFDGQVALITGAGASKASTEGGTSFGRACAIRLAEEGASVVCADIDEAGVAETVAAVKAAGGAAVGTKLDVSSESSVRQALSQAVSEFGALNVLMNMTNAPNDAPWDAMIAITLTGTYYTLLHGAAEIAKHGGGAVVTRGTVLSLVGSSRPPQADEGERSGGVGHAGLVAAKHGLVGLTRQFALAYAERGVRVNIVAPCYVDSTRGVDAETRRFRESLIPMGRLGKLEETAAAAAFLASADASFITGCVLPIDGGYTAR